MAMLAVLDRLGYGHVTVHGFRATFATWAEECTDYPHGVREAALAHKYKNETVAAYHAEPSELVRLPSLRSPAGAFENES
jgi:integrase